MARSGLTTRKPISWSGSIVSVVSQRVCVPFHEFDGESRVGRSRPRDAEHFARRVDASDNRASFCQRKRCAPGACCHVENAAAGHIAEKLGEHSFLILQKEHSNRPAKPFRVEAGGHRRVGVRGIAVVIFAFRKKGV